MYTTFTYGAETVGQIFGLNPEVYYIYAPLKLFYKAGLATEGFNESQASAMLKEVLKCEMDTLINTAIVFNMKTLNSLDYVKWWGQRTFCQNKVLVTDEEDHKTSGMNVRQHEGRWNHNQVCDPLNTKDNREICLGHESRVVMTKALRNITSLMALLESGVKVIHLVRDPRADIARVRGERDIPLMEVSSWFCSGKGGDLKNVLALYRNRPNTLRNYRLVRFEDFVYELESKTERLADFLGFNISEAVRKWIKEFSNTPEGKRWTETRRKSRTIENWRTTISHEDMIKLQNDCRDILNILGYREFNNIEEQSNKTVSVLEEMRNFPRDRLL